jgi:leukotriene A-4 hydrolase/aminopeptidase
MAKVDPHSFYDDLEPKIKSFDLKMKIDFENQAILSSVKLNFEREVTGKIHLDSRDLQINSVHLEDGTELSFKVDDKKPIVGNLLEIDFSKPSQSVVVNYEVKKESSALQWLKPEQTKGKVAPYLFTQCQPHHARSLIPLQDSPSVRVTYSAEISVRKDLTVVMAAGSSGLKEDEEYKTFLFKMPQPIPPYLFAFAIGRITSSEIGPRSRVWAEPEMIEKASYEFEEIENIIKTAENLFGPYEWERYDLLVLPPSFPYGGMENPRCTFITPTIIVGDRSLVGVVAHELAHSWTGNLVTNKNCNHFWINEGFTVWAERRITEALYGVEAATMAYAQGFYALKNAIEEFGVDSPYTCLVTNLEGVDPDEVFSDVPYEKGSLFLRLLEETVSRKSFDRFIRAYIEKFRFSSIGTDELVSFINEYFEGLLEKVDAEKWLYKPGIPENCPKIFSSRLEYIKNLSAGFKFGTYPTKEEIALMKPSEKLVYFQGLPRKLSEEECQFLDKNFELREMTNTEILCEWFIISATSNYKPAFKMIKNFLLEVGRMKFVKPIYKAMGTNQETRQLAREIFEITKESLHPLTKTIVEQEIANYEKD